MQPNDGGFEIRAFPRLHVSLLDLSGRGYRRAGGIGFALDALPLEFKFERTPVIDVSELAYSGYTSTDIERLSRRLEELKAEYQLTSGITIRRASLARRHSGLGTGTATALSCIEGLLIANGVNLPPKTIQALSKRGGVSGIGINSYFSGGFVLDVGTSEQGQPFLPSGACKEVSELPLPLIIQQMPEWDIGLVLLDHVCQISLDAERAFFNATCPIAVIDVYEAVYHAVFGAATAVRADDFAKFCEAINAIQTCVWKRAELSLYDNHIASTMERMRDLGCDAVGMSSVGPTLFFLASKFDDVYSRVEKGIKHSGLIRTKPRNIGREICRG